MNGTTRSMTEELKFRLTKQGYPASAISEVMPTLEPIIQLAESNQYTLATAEKLSAQDMIGILSLVYGKKINEVIFVSTSAPYQKPNWMSQKVYENSLVSILDLVKESAVGLFHKELHDAFIRFRFEQAIPLWDLLKAVFEDSLPKPALQLLWYYLALYWVNQENKARLFEPMIQIAKQCCPWGFHADNPDTFIVLVA